MNKVYRGERNDDGSVSVTVDGRPLSPVRSQKIRNHSPDGFNWGYGGSGPAQLALAILLDVTGDPLQAEQQYQQFKAQHVASWDGDVWTITAAEVCEWLSLSLTRDE